VCTEKSSHILDGDQPGAEPIDDVGHVVPQAGAGAAADAGAATSEGHVLAGKPTSQHVDGFDPGPVGGGDVTEVRHVRVVVGEDPGRGRVYLAVPGDPAAEDLADGHVEAAVAGE